MFIVGSGTAGRATFTVATFVGLLVSGTAGSTTFIDTSLVDLFGSGTVELTTFTEAEDLDSEIGLAGEADPSSGEAEPSTGEARVAESSEVSSRR